MSVNRLDTWYLKASTRTGYNVPTYGYGTDRKLTKLQLMNNEYQHQNIKVQTPLTKLVFVQIKS